MASIIADNIISPLGFTSRENYCAVKSGNTGLCRNEGIEGIPFVFTASLFSEDQRKAFMMAGYTEFESLAIRSISAALSDIRIELDDRTILLLSTTKGNVGLLQREDNPENVVSLGVAAKRISTAIGFKTEPIVVSNACISGVSALILGQRLVDSGLYDNVIVCGADLQNPFVISGFQSFKALSEEECRPFDMERHGLNLGEAAATIVLSKNGDSEPVSEWRVIRGVVRNDAFHISTPSPIGEGSRLAMLETIRNITIKDIAQINLHGTATMYNDQMESKAITRAGLSDIPSSALKGYVGHTMGASGLMETILTMQASDDDTVLGTRGFEELGVSGKINISSDCRTAYSSEKGFLKTISGFGGGNAAVFLKKSGDINNVWKSDVELSVTHSVRITPISVSIDGEDMDIPENTDKILTWLYKKKVGDYPKYYKMDHFSRLGFLASELLLEAEKCERFTESCNRGIVLFSKKGSFNSDKAYLDSIVDTDNYYPSPSLFVYTLPNIVVGEIAIRNKYHGETSFYILNERNEVLFNEVLKSTFCDSQLESVIAGWIDYQNENSFEVELFIINEITAK